MITLAVFRETVGQNKSAANFVGGPSLIKEFRVVGASEIALKALQHALSLVQMDKGSRTSYHWGMCNVFRLAILLSTFVGSVALAQPEGGASAGGAGAGEDAAKDSVFEMGFHLGNLLPNQIGGVSEIMGLGGARMGIRMAPGSYFETGVIMGNGEGQKWKNIHADVRMDIPVENLVAIAYIGADAVYYSGQGNADRLIFGGHAGGGVQIHLSGSAWFRSDMKFGFSPGTSLYIGFGLSFRL